MGNVEQSRKGVVVDKFMRSVSNKNVYAAGDAADTGGLPLTPIAGIEGDGFCECGPGLYG